MTFTETLFVTPDDTYRLSKKNTTVNHCVKSVRIRSYSGLYSPAFGLNTERYGISFCIQSECGKTWARITPITDTFYTVKSLISTLYARQGSTSTRYFQLVVQMSLSHYFQVRSPALSSGQVQPENTYVCYSWLRSGRVKNVYKSTHRYHHLLI